MKDTNHTILSINEDNDKIQYSFMIKALIKFDIKGTYWNMIGTIYHDHS